METASKHTAVQTRPGGGDGGGGEGGGGEGGGLGGGVDGGGGGVDGGGGDGGCEGGVGDGGGGDGGGLGDGHRSAVDPWQTASSATAARSPLATAVRRRSLELAYCSPPPSPPWCALRVATNERVNAMVLPPGVGGSNVGALKHSMVSRLAVRSSAPEFDNMSPGASGANAGDGANGAGTQSAFRDNRSSNPATSSRPYCVSHRLGATMLPWSRNTAVIFTGHGTAGRPYTGKSRAPQRLSAAIAVRPALSAFPISRVPSWFRDSAKAY